MKRIAFYAPLKPPDHPIPSGDRQMARMLLSALNKAGHDAFLASRLISYSKRHGLEHMAARKAAAHEEADRLLGEWDADGNPPDLWFCYHPYDKSPDWLGMEICTRLGIPMVTAEPCKTGQGANGEWLPWRAEAQESMRMAAVNIVMTDSDE
ncbi:MAG: glycosyltransferase family 1 protein, partial [Nitratireductor sp.]|nr:glycosyltransferase family 1 protein [Nitratireductor sp.]